MMKFRRRESERGDFQQPDAGRPPQPSSRRASESFQGDSPEPTPVAVPPTQSGPPSVVSVASSSGGQGTKINSSITTQTPDNVIGATLVVQGRVEFQNLLRIDGHFEGELIGQGSLIIGPTAEVISNLKGLDEVYVEGILIGDCVCNKMQIRFAGCVTGNLVCASLGMDPSVVLKGSANINPREKFDKSKSSAPRPRQKTSGRSMDETSSRSSTAVASPESVSSRTHESHKRRGSSAGGDSRPEGTRPEGSGGGLKRETSSDSNTSSLHTLNDDVPMPHPPKVNGGGGGDKVVPARATPSKAPVQGVVSSSASVRAKLVT